MNSDSSFYAVCSLPEGTHAEACFAALAHCPGRMWLDSSQPVAETGRFSILTASPYAGTFASGHSMCDTDAHGQQKVQAVDDVLEALHQRLNAPGGPRTPPPLGLPFAGGAIGYLGYDLCTGASPVAGAAVATAGVLPDAALLFYDAALVFDHHTGGAWAVGCGLRGPAEAALKRLLAKLDENHPQAELPASRCLRGGDVRSNFTRREFCRAVRQARRYIAAGDIYQVNLAQRFTCAQALPAADLYCRLRQRNPSSYGAFLDFGKYQVLSSSPERFLRIRGLDINTRPIKGTRPRGKNPSEDNTLRQALLASPKERAELLMIVDLERNDLGRICAAGSIRVDHLYQLESYATVHHMVASVSGILRPDMNTADILRATFPGGSVTGAPKIRAMEVIAELESLPRGVFTGALGYFAVHGDVDLNIAIRTLVRTDTEVHFHVGSGIVWDSDPEAEYEETLAKGEALFAALGVKPNT